ncbi:MAG: hypothetical protein D6702_02950 [Planctomycetota bacterium]|nr:MAG: hypothetical protein D6702_02950 [Planctomycetota bacterium]
MGFHSLAMALIVGLLLGPFLLAQTVAPGSPAQEPASEIPEISRVVVDRPVWFPRDQDWLPPLPEVGGTPYRVMVVGSLMDMSGGHPAPDPREQALIAQLGPLLGRAVPLFLVERFRLRTSVRLSACLLRVGRRGWATFADIDEEPFLNILRKSGEEVDLVVILTVLRQGPDRWLLSARLIDPNGKEKAEEVKVEFDPLQADLASVKLSAELAGIFFEGRRLKLQDAPDWYLHLPFQNYPIYLVALDQCLTLETSVTEGSDRSALYGLDDFLATAMTLVQAEPPSLNARLMLLGTVRNLGVIAPDVLAEHRATLEDLLTECPGRSEAGREADRRIRRILADLKERG